MVAPQGASAPSGKQGGIPKAPAPAIPMPASVHEGDPFIGATLNNRFKVEDKLGEGGFGAVYRGVQSGTGRNVAIKMLHPEMTRDKNVLARFRREGEVLCSLRDAHTITTYDFDQTDDGTLFIAMELLSGKSLHDVFRKEAPVDWRRMFTLAAQMCSSLTEAHSMGIVHRDLKPENIYLEERPGIPEFVKILDFGIAKVMRGDGSDDKKSPQLTATGQTLGTLEYMSPEQLMGKELDGTSDIYAVGVLCYEMITGQLPFPDAVGPAALISAQLRQVPPPPSEVVPQAGIPAQADAIIMKCLNKGKADRYPDCSALKMALEGAMAQSRQPSNAGAQAAPPYAAPAAPAVAPEPAAGVGGAPRAQPLAPTQTVTEQGRSNLVLWAAIAIVIIGGAVGAFFAFGGG